MHRTKVLLICQDPPGCLARILDTCLEIKSYPIDHPLTAWHLRALAVSNDRMCDRAPVLVSFAAYCPTVQASINLSGNGDTVTDQESFRICIQHNTTSIQRQEAVSKSLEKRYKRISFSLQFVF